MRRPLTAAAIAMSLSCLSAVACTTTAGVPITLRLELVSLSDGRSMTPSGWEIELEEAVVLIGPVYAYAPLEEPDVMAAAGALLGPPVARAHGGFDPLDGRLVRAEYLEQVGFDALSNEPLDVGAVPGLLGAVESASVVLDVPRGDLASPAGPTGGHHLWVSGRATREDVTVAFEGGLDLPGEEPTRVDGIEVTGGALSEGATLQVGIDAAMWLAEADFTVLGEQAPGGGAPVEIDAESQPFRAWLLGARTAGAYRAEVIGGR